MSSIDERVVRMSFDNKQFEQGVSSTLNSLSNLKKGLQLQGATKGLEEISAASDKVDLHHISDSAEKISGKFKAMSVVAVTALATITQRAVSAGASLLKSFTLGPIIDGFKEYETNLNSIQTILANTQASGATLKDVEASLQDLNHYSDQTIYNFSEMARNIGTFTAAGVDLKTSAAAIKGIANLAALSGSNSEQASTAMYQLSQAISSGTFSLEDWNSVVNAGMGGTVFQRALAQTAEKMGTLSDGAVKLSGKMKNVSINGESFRQSITAKPGQKSWLTSKVLTSTLQQFTGDLSDAQLKAEGFSKSQIKAIQAQAKTAKEAATQVKTLSQLFDTTKEAIGSGWSQTFQLIFGDFTEAKGLFTGISNAVNNVVSNSSKARNKMLSDWKKLGGRDDLIKGITNAVKAFASVLKPIKDAFREIFPATTGKQLADMTKTFRDFTAKLKIGGDTADKLKRTFAGVFAIFGIGWDIVKGVAETLFHLFGVATQGSGGILKLTANIGDFLVNLKKAIERGDGLTKFFEVLGKILALPIKLIQKLAGYVGSLFDKFDSSKAEKSITGMTKKLTPLQKLGELVSNAWGDFFDWLGRVSKLFGPFADKFSNFFQNLGSEIASGLGGLDFSDVLNGINTGLFAGLILLVKKFVSKFKGGEGIANGFIETITGPFEELTNTLKTMQGTLKATTLLEIAAAIGILAVSMTVLSKIDSRGLIRASSAITVMFSQLIGALAIFQKFVGTEGFLKLPFVMASLILLAAAVDILASAVKKLSVLDWNGLAKGLTGLTVILGGLVGALKFMPRASGLISTSLGLIALAGAIKILVSAVTDLSGLSWSEMAKGLAGTAALLGSLVLFTKFADADKGGVLKGAGIILLATGIKILASAMKDISGLSWTDIAKGLAGTAGGLGAMAGALALLPPSSVLSSAAILVVATSLNKIGDALANMSQMSWEEIAKGLVALAGSLGIIAGAMILMTEALPGAAALWIVAASLGNLATFLAAAGGMSWEALGKAASILVVSLAAIAAAMILMTEALPGAAALLVVSAALAILTPVLTTLGQMSWEEIAKGLTTLAGVFVILGAAGLLLAPLVPVIVALAAAITLLGIGVLAAGVGVLAFSAALTALSIAGSAGAAAMVVLVTSMLKLLPLAAKEIGLAIIAFANVIATAGPAMTKAMVTVLDSVINAITVETPKIVNMLLKMLEKLLSALVRYVPKLTDEGGKLIVGILEGIAKHIGKLVDAGTDVIVNFLKGIQRNLPRLTDAAADTIIKFINSVADAIRKHKAALHSAGKNLASAIIEGMIAGISGGISGVVSAAKRVASSAIAAAKAKLHINSPSKDFIAIGSSTTEGFVKGINTTSDTVEKASAGMGATAIDSLKSAMASLSDAVSGEVDINPTIAPVLDLSDVRKNAAQIGGLLRAQPITVGTTYSEAQNASAGYSANQELTTVIQAPQPPKPITFNQYNNSPKALSAAEIYRQTKNQISVAKGALDKTNA